MDKTNKKFSFLTYGIATPHYKSWVLLSLDELLLPLGPNIVLWNLKTKEKRLLIVTQSVIMSILTFDMNGKKIAVTVSYNGEINFIDIKEWTIIKEIKAIGCCFRHASVFDGKLLACAEEFEKFKGLPQVYNIESLIKGQDVKDSILFHIKGRFRFGEILKNNLVFLLKKNPLSETEIKEKGLYIEAKTSATKGPKSKKKAFNYNMELYSISQGEKSDIPIKSELLPEVCEIIVSAISEDQKFLGFLYSNRNLLVIDPSTLSRLFQFKLHGSGCIMTLSFKINDPNTLVLVPKSGGLMTINCPTLSKSSYTAEIIVPEEKVEGVLYEKMKGSDVFQEGNYIGVLTPESYISFNSEGLHKYDLFTQKTLTLQLSSITHCGLALNSAESLMAVGDFLGSIYIFATEYIDSEPIYITNVGSGVRSLTFGPSKSDSVSESAPYLLIGCMDGSLFQWFYTEVNEFPSQICPNLEGSITCLRTFPPNLILASTTEGLVSIFAGHPTKGFVLLSSLRAHLPQKDHDKEAFGSLGKFAEVWSASWDPRSDNNC